MDKITLSGEVRISRARFHSDSCQRDCRRSSRPASVAHKRRPRRCRSQFGFPPMWSMRSALPARVGRRGSMRFCGPTSSRVTTSSDVEARRVKRMQLRRTSLGSVLGSCFIALCPAVPQVPPPGLRCVWIHGRLYATNGTPALRLWEIGTHHPLWSSAIEKWAFANSQIKG